ncbi:MAG TPA: glycosyltransferase [bacterium]|nr:glycosyltransferase [bacterium]
MHWIIIGLTGFYVLNACYYFLGIRRLKKQSGEPVPFPDTWPLVSVIIPVRNEQTTIAHTLDCLLSQGYPGDRFEIIVVDDHSTDRTSDIITDYQEKHERIETIRIDQVPDGISGKKHAVKSGMDYAEGEIIVTTDGDVEMGTEWLERMVGAFKQETGMVAGITVYKSNTRLLHVYQSLDAASLSIISAAMIANGTPLTCQGSNLAYRKSAYEDVDGFTGVDHITSGDDDLLMQKIDTRTEWRIKAITDPDSIVYTRPADTLIEVINQRSRWASKGTVYPKNWTRIYLPLIYLSMLGFIAGILFLPLGLFGTIWLAKLAVDSTMTRLVMSIVRESSLRNGFLPVAIGQPFVVVIAGLRGLLGQFTWKH